MQRSDNSGVRLSLVVLWCISGCLALPVAGQDEAADVIRFKIPITFPCYWKDQI